MCAHADKMPETAGKFEPLFITIDPERDGPKQLKDYLADWHPRMIGLTGNNIQFGHPASIY